MKQLLTSLLLLATLYTLESCGDSCRRTNCGDSGYCYEGQCICTKWYSGERCQLLFNRNYEGQYFGDDEGVHGPKSLELNLEADQEIPNRMIVDYGFYMEFETDSTLTIPVQSLVLDKDTLVINGVGEYSLETLNLRFAEVKSDGEDFLSDEWVFNFSGAKVKSDMQ
ncbi:MAG: hypothetical protein R2813_11935 [Flavobacteriales bacterium]